MIIQNAAQLTVPIKQGSYRIPLKMIGIHHDYQVMHLLSMFSTGTMDVPEGDAKSVISFTHLSELSVYLNLFDKDGDCFVENLNLIVISTDSGNVNKNFLHRELLINRKLDLSKSYLSYKFDKTIPGYMPDPYLLFYTFYKKRAFRFLSNDIAGLKNFHYPIELQASENRNIQLSEIVGRVLDDKKIRRIISDQDQTSQNGYIDIRGKNGEVIENLPLAFFQKATGRNIFLDGIDIDYEKSFLRFRRTSYGTDAIKINLTFIY